MARQRLGLEEPRCLAPLGLPAGGAAIDRALHGALTPSRSNLARTPPDCAVALAALRRAIGLRPVQ